MRTMYPDSLILQKSGPHIFRPDQLLQGILLRVDSRGESLRFDSHELSQYRKQFVWLYMS